MDSKHNIVVNVRITPANVNDVEPVAEILNDIEKRLGKQPKYMGLDAGYHSAPVCHQLAAAGIQPVIGYRRHTHKGGTISGNTVSPMTQSKTFPCVRKGMS